MGKVGCHEREESGNTDAQEGSAPITLIGRGQEGALRCVNTGPAQGLPTRAWRTASRGHHPSGRSTCACRHLHRGTRQGVPSIHHSANSPTNVAGARQSARPTNGETPPWRRCSPMTGQVFAPSPAPATFFREPLRGSQPSDRPPTTFAAPPLRPTRHHARPAVASPPGCPILPSRL